MEQEHIHKATVAFDRDIWNEFKAGTEYGMQSLIFRRLVEAYLEYRKKDYLNQHRVMTGAFKIVTDPASAVDKAALEAVTAPDRRPL